MGASSISGFSIPSIPTANFTKSTLAGSSFPAPGLGASASHALAGSQKGLSKADLAERTRATAQDFEAVFINSMFKQMMSGVGEGPYSGGQAAGVWRSFLTDEYAKSFVKAGGIGIAADVQRALLAQQEAR